MTTERTPSHLPIDDFDPEVDVPNEYFERFEGTVDAVTNTSGKEALYKTWFPLKLKSAARRVWNSVDKTKDWDIIKTQFKSLLVSPQQKYQWRAGHNRVRWDGRENFHSLASRVKTDVDIHQDSPREDDYYFNFRNALPKDYQAAIDLGVKDETLEEAKRVAFRYQTASSTQAELGAAKSVAFTGAFTGASMEEERKRAMEKDRLKTLELSMQGMSLQVENNAADMKKLMSLLEDTARGRSQSSNRQGLDRSPSRGREGGNRDGDYRNRDYRSPDRDRYDNRNGRYDDRRRNDDRCYDDRRYDDRRYDDRRYDDRRYDDRRYDDRRNDDRRYDNRADDRRPQDSRDYNQPRQGDNYGNERGASGGYDQSGGRYNDRRDNRNQGRNSPRPGSPGRFSPGRQGGNRDQGQRYSPRQGGRGPSQERQPHQGRRDDRGNSQSNRDGSSARAVEFESPIDFFCAALVNGMDNEQLTEQVRRLSEQNQRPKN